MIETVSRIIAAWGGVGATTAATPAKIYSYFLASHLRGPKYDSRGTISPRYVSAIPEIAALIGGHAPIIRSMLVPDVTGGRHGREVRGLSPVTR